MIHKKEKKEKKIVKKNKKKQKTTTFICDMRYYVSNYNITCLML